MILDKSQILRVVLTKINCSFKSGIPKCAPESRVHVQVLLVVCGLSVVDLSFDRKDGVRVRHDCWRHVEIMWPFPAFSFRIFWFFWNTWICCRFLRYFIFMIAPGFRFRNFPQHMIFICCDRFPCYFLHQSAKICILQSRLSTRRCVEFRIPSCPRVRFPCRCFEFPGLLDAIESFADEELVETVEDRFIAVGLDFATIPSSSFCSCTLFAIVSFWSS